MRLIRLSGVNLSLIHIFWWGHRIPAWYCDDCGETVVAMDEPKICPKCGSTHLTQDPDTLDTWFSSALWPFSTLGWPEKTEDLDYFYPTDVLVTGYDIIFFWVIRMVFSGLEQTGECLFNTRCVSETRPCLLKPQPREDLKERIRGLKKPYCLRSRHLLVRERRPDQMET